MENNNMDWEISPKKIDKKKIVTFVGAGLIAASLIAGIGVYDAQVDHTKEVCAITQVMNLIPNTTYNEFGIYAPTGVLGHQMKEMEKDLVDEGIEDAIVAYVKDKTIESEGTVTQTILPMKSVLANGEVVYSVPAGYVLVQDENGQMVGEKEVKATEVFTGIHATWGESTYDAKQDKVFHEGEVYLRTR